MNPQPKFIDLSSRPSQPAPRVERRSVGEAPRHLLHGMRRPQELFGSTARALRLHALPTTVPIHLASQLYELCAARKDQVAVERLLERLEADLRAGRPGLVDALLERLEVQKLAPAVLVAALTITFPAKADLHAREGFLHRVEELLRKILGDERATSLLATRR